ncbi:MAG: nucleotidyltransferase family protein [Acidimicrobiales bacterium]
MTVTAKDALGRLERAAADGRLDELCRRFDVGVLGAFGSALDPDAEPGDLDLAVSFDGQPRMLELIDALVDLTGFDGVDILDLDGASPVARARGVVGRGLFESEPGRWAITQMAALAEERDTAHLRALDLTALQG